MIFDLFDEVRDAAPPVEGPTELQIARHRHRLTAARADGQMAGDRRADDHGAEFQMPAARGRRGARLRGRSGKAVAGVAAAVLVGAGIVASLPGSSGTKTTKVASPVVDTPHAVLYRLASVSIADPVLTGRYVILAETDSETGYPGTSERTTVVDTETGASTTYQQPYTGSDAPAVLTEGPDPSGTEAWFAALPTDPVALRTKLLAIARQQQLQADQAMSAAAARAGKAMPVGAGQPRLTDDDLVYQEADTLLWSPLVQPDLRAALYKVLADTSGFTITTTGTDPLGRPAVAMVRHYNGVPETDTTYENPATGAVVAQVWNETNEVLATNAGVGTTPTTNTITATYQPVTASDTIPPNPYGN